MYKRAAGTQQINGMDRVLLFVSVYTVGTISLNSFFPWFAFLAINNPPVFKAFYCATLIFNCGVAATDSAVTFAPEATIALAIIAPFCNRCIKDAP